MTTSTDFDQHMNTLESLLVEAKKAAVAAQRESEPMSRNRRLLMWINSELSSMIDAVVDHD